MNRKGGTGKTETARALSAGFTLKGYKTLLLDLDAQGNLTDATGADASGKTILDVLEGKAGLQEAIQGTEQGDIIPASGLLYSCDKNILSAYALKKLFKHLQYDFIIIDTPPSMTAMTAAALCASDGVIITTHPDRYDVLALQTIWQEIEAIREQYNAALKIYGICITRYTNTRLNKEMAEMMEAAAGQMSTKVYGNYIRECVAVKESALYQKSIFDYAKRSNAAADYAALVDELLADLQA